MPRAGWSRRPISTSSSRHHLDRVLWDPYDPLLQQVAPRVAAGLARRRFYVEKQNSLVPFIPELTRLFGARFVVPVRDGRDVAASLVDWHNQMFPIIYQECREEVLLGPHAQAVLAAQQGASEFDYSLPRPAKDDPWFSEWPGFTRFEMAAWYWNAINLRLSRLLDQLPNDHFMLVDYTRPSTDAIRRVYDFIGLPDFDADAVDAVLDRKVNSLADRIAAAPRFPRWPDWDTARRQRFDDIAHQGMAALGYAEPTRRPEPGIGRRRPSPVSSEAVAAADRWLARGRNQTGSVLRLDEPESGGVADTVVSLGGLDQAADVDEVARRIAARSRRFLYLRASADYHDDMAEHRYRHAAGAVAVDVSVPRLAATLCAEGFAEVIAFPRGTEAGRRETIVVAARDRIPEALRPAASDVAFAFAPYIVTDSDLDRAALERQINAACAYLSAPPFGLSDELPRAGEWFAALRELPDRHFGTVAALATGEGGVNSALRIDIDADLVAAIGLAGIARECGMPASFYVLHTSGYYGRLEAGRWQRHGAAAAIYREIQDLGCEIGLHIDPYKLYLDDGIDGAAALTTELAWLRSEGLRIAGTSAHNCVPVYGVENFEVFRGHEIRRGGWVSRRGRVAPLGVLDPAAFGLTYEAGAARRGSAADDPDRCPFVTDWPVLDLVRDPDWMRQYLHENPYAPWGYEARLWGLGPDRWALSCRTDALTAFVFDRPFEAIRPTLASLAPHDRLVVTLHPEYFGRRDGPDCYPRGMP